MLFCLCIHKLISSLSSEFCVFYLDDGTIGGNFEDLQADLEKAEDQGKTLGLLLNVENSELISHCQSAVSTVYVQPFLAFSLFMDIVKTHSYAQ